MLRDENKRILISIEFWTGFGSQLLWIPPCYLLIEDNRRLQCYILYPLIISTNYLQMALVLMMIPPRTHMATPAPAITMIIPVPVENMTIHLPSLLLNCVVSVVGGLVFSPLNLVYEPVKAAVDSFLTALVERS